MGVALIFLTGGSAKAADTTWTATSGNWTTSADWSNGVPTSTSLVTILGGAVTINTSAPVANEVLISLGGSLTITGAGTLTATTGTGPAVELVATGTTLVNNGILITPEFFVNAGTTAYLMGNTAGVGLTEIQSGGVVNIGIGTNGVATGEASQTLGDIGGDTGSSIVIGKSTGGVSTILTLDVSNNVNDFFIGETATSITGSVFNGVISGGGGLNVAGAGGVAGTLALGGINTYTGTTTIGSDATVDLTGSGSIATSASVTVNSGGSLNISGLTAGTTVQNLGGDSTGTVVLGANTLTDQVNTSATFGGAITGTGGLTVQGTGVLILSGANNAYTGTTLINSGATLALSGTGTIADSSLVKVAGTFDISGTSATIGDLSGSGIVALGNKTLTVSTSTTDLFSGVIKDGGLSGGTAGSLVVEETTGDTGTLILTGANTYTGTTTISSGTLQIGNGGTTGTLGTGAVSLGSSTELAFDHASGSIFTVANTLSSTDATAKLVQEGGGTTILTGADGGFTGAVSVNRGTLEVDNALGAAGSTVAVASGATLRGTGTVGAVTVANGGTIGAGTASTPGTLHVNSLALNASSTVVLREASGASDSIVVATNTSLAGNLEFLLSGTATTLSSATALQGISGGITGATTFSNVIIGGAGILILTGANTYAGSVQINQGTTLQLGAGGSISAPTLVTVNGTFDISAAGSETIKDLAGSGTMALGSHALTVTTSTSDLFSGAIQDGGLSGGTGGSLVVGGTGTLILAGTNTYTGGTTIGATATLQLGNGATTGTVGSGDIALGGTLALDGNANTPLTLSNNLIGTGQLKQLSGTTVINGADNRNFTGITTVSGGVLEIDPAQPISTAFGSSTINVTGGTLRGTADLLGNVNVTGGTLAAGTTSTPGTLTIGGNLTMTSASSAAFRVTGPTTADQVNVGGTATVAGNMKFYVSGMTVRAGETFNLITATGGGTGSFNVTSALANALGYQTAWNGSTLQAIAVQNSFMPFGAGGNQTAVAAGLDQVASDARSAAMINYLNALPGSQLGAALAQIAPTSIASMPSVLRTSSDNVSQALSLRMGALREGATGLSLNNLDLGPNTTFDPRSLLVDNSDTAPIGYTPLPLNFLAPTPDNRWGTFISGLGTSGQVDDAAVPGYKYYSGGFQAGIDYRLLPSLMVGVSGGYQHGQTDFNDSNSTVQVDTGNIQVYSTWNDHNGDWASANLGGAYDWFNSKRESLDGTAEAKPTGTEINGAVEGGHDFQRGSWTMTPKLGLLYSRTMEDGFTETGSLAPLTIDSHDADSLRSRLGFRLANRFELGSTAIPVEPYVEAGWQHEYLDQNQAFTARFASGAGGLFSVSGSNVGSDSATFGFGVGALFSPSITAGLSYFGQANDDYIESDIEGTIRYMF